MLRIRRVEFRIAEIPIVAIPLLLLVSDLSFLYRFEFWEGIFIFFLLFAFGDMINCLADRDLDAVYKPHLSEAVYGLGVPFVTFQVIASAVVAVLLSFHLSWITGRWIIAAITVIGLLLGAAYSVKPVQLKGRGLLQLICLWTIIFVGPIFFVSQLVTAEISTPLVIFAAFYGLAQMGIILVNTAEDYPEDLASGISTSIVALGLHRGIRLALFLAIIGSLGSLVSLVGFYPHPTAVLVGLIPPVAAAVFVVGSIWGLNRKIDGRPLEESIITVKKAGRNVPLWVTSLAWSMLWASAVVYYYR